MVLQKQITTIPIGSTGMDSSQDPKINQGNTQIFNADYSVDGIISKREGYDAIATTDAQNVNLASYGDSVLVWGSGASLCDADSTSQIATNLGIMNINSNVVYNENQNITFQCDYAELDDIYVVSYGTVDSDDAYGLYVESFNKQTNKRIDTLTLKAPTTYGKKQCRLLRTPADTIRYYWCDDDGYMEQGVVDNAGSIGSSSNITGVPVLDTSNIQFDVCVMPGSSISFWDVLLITNRPNATYSRIYATIISKSESTVYEGSLNLPILSSVSGISCWYQSGGVFGFACYTAPYSGNQYCYFGASDNALVNFAFMHNAVVDYSDNLIRNIAGVRTGANQARIYITQLEKPVAPITSYTPSVYVSEYSWTPAGYVGTLITDNVLKLKQHQLALKPMHTADNNHITGFYTKSWGTELTAQDQVLFVESDYNLVGRTSVGVARFDEYGQNAQWDAYNFCGNICQVDWSGLATDGYKGACVIPKITRLATTNNQMDNFILERNVFSWLDSYGNNSVEMKDAVILSNSVPYYFTGSGVTDLGFATYPEQVFGSVYLSGGSLTADATYKYRVVYEEIDSAGKIHRSAPTPTPLTIILATGQTAITIQVPTFTNTRRQNVASAIYRTTANGTRYYRIYSFYHKDYPNTTYVPINDTIADSEITASESLYTDASELENIMPLGHNISCLWQNRYVYVDSTNKESRIYYSKLPAIDQSSAISFNDALYFEVNSAGGNITGLFPFYNKLIIFKNQHIYATSGSGYDNRGAGSNFSEPWLISSNIGCINNKSIVPLPNGVMFQSERGLWMLSQGEQLSPIGSPVQHEVYDSNWSVGGSGVIPNRNEVVVLASDGYSMAFNWLKNKWSLLDGINCIDAKSVNNSIYWIDNNYTINVNKENIYNNNGDFYSLLVDTGWISLLGLKGYSRVFKVFIIGQKNDDLTLNVKVAYDLDPYFADDDNFDAAALTSFSISSYYDDGLGVIGDDAAFAIEVPLSRQKVSSIRFRISDTNGTTGSVGLGLTALVIEYGGRPGAQLTASTKVLGE